MTARSVDVLVVGSGAGAMMAALCARARGADVLVIEKSDEYGGTSATSGGGIWIPNSSLAAAAGLADSEDEAFLYIRALSAANVPDDNIRAFVANAPRMLDWMEHNTPVRYQSVPYPDYHADIPGGKPGFRTHLPLEIDGRLLGADVAALRAASPAASLIGRINWNFSETNALLFRTKGWQKILARMLWRYYGDVRQRLSSRKDRFLTLGNALVGGLRLAMKAQEIPLWLDTALVELVTEEGRVAGAVVERGGERMRIDAGHGIILAAGGFERNSAMRAMHLPMQPDPVYSGGQVNNTGDAIEAAAARGAATMNMHSAWWATVFSVPGEARGRLSAMERALPGSIIVNQAGERFLNEAAAYEVVARRMLETNQPGKGTQPSWMIFDANFRRKYPAGPVLPLVPDWLHPAAVRSILRKSPTIEALAAKIGVPAGALAATIRRFNVDARNGVDRQFQRGEATYDRMYGDQRQQPNSTLAPLDKAPFYALPIYAGDLGTNGGLVTDGQARVLDKQSRPMPGLYAIGNTAASVMGESYPGAGATLGPALTFGYIAGRHIVGAND